MGFLVDVQPFDFAAERRYFVAERDGARRRLPRGGADLRARRAGSSRTSCAIRRAPNGTAELLIDAAMRALGDEGSRYVTLGLAPLVGAGQGLAARGAPAVVAAVRLRRAARLQGQAAAARVGAGVPGAPAGQRRATLALVDALAAFAHGSFLRFGGATLLRGPALVVRVLAALLVPWTALLALADERWFPARWVQAAWIGFDLTLVAALFALTWRWRHWLGVAVAAAISLDAVLTLAQVTLWDSPHVHGLEWLLVAVGLAGPALAAVVLWGAVGHRRGPD